MNKPKKSKNLSRRTFLRNLSIGTLAAGGLGGVLLTRNSQEPYQQFYDKHLAGKKGRDFLHPESSKPYVPSEKEKVLFGEQFEKIRPYFKEVSSVRYYTGKSFEEFPVSENTFKSFEEHMRGITKTFFSSLGIARELPPMVFHHLTAQTLLKQEENVLHYYLAGSMREGTIAQYVGTFQNGRTGGAYLVDGINGGGDLESKERIQFVNKAKGFRFEKERIHRAFIAASKDAVTSFTSVPAEALHYVLRGLRRDCALEDINRRVISEKSTLPTIREIQETMQEWAYREEGVVHALLDQFLERRQEQERFGAKDMQDYLHLEEISPYHYVPRMRETLNKTSPAVFLKEYRANPRSFFTHDALKKEE